MRILTILSALLLVSCGYDPRKTDSHDVTTNCENCKPLPYETYEPEPMPQPQQPAPCKENHNNADSDYSNSNSNINHNYNSIDCCNYDCEETNQNEPEEPEETEERKCSEYPYAKRQACKPRA